MIFLYWAGSLSLPSFMLFQLILFVLKSSLKLTQYSNTFSIHIKFFQFLLLTSLYIINVFNSYLISVWFIFLMVIMCIYYTWHYIAGVAWGHCICCTLGIFPTSHFFPFSSFIPNTLFCFLMEFYFYFNVTHTYMILCIYMYI